MVTFDRLGYEFHQVGEYVYSTDGGDFVLQVRMGQCSAGFGPACNVALAANMAGDRVGYYRFANEPLLVNGLPAAVPEAGITLPHGGRIQRVGTGGNAAYEFAWPSGERVTAVGADVRVRTTNRTRQYFGLLGGWDGNPSNDLKPRGGGPPRPAVDSLSWLYGAFGDSWRVTQAESLFDYGPGQDTSTFTDDAFPANVVIATTLPTARFNEAHAACTAAGITDETQLDGCILDVAVSGGNPTVAEAIADAGLPPTAERVVFGGYFQDFRCSFPPVQLPGHFQRCGAAAALSRPRGGVRVL
jgi:hypothetical protein